MGKYLVLICFLSVCSFAAAAADTIDYSLYENWWAHPETADHADHVPDGGFTNNQDSALSDVFYIHPTTYYRGFEANAPLDNKTVERLTNVVILNQATVFNGSCKVYAPKYRQTRLKEFLMKEDPARLEAFDRAYADVRAAFEHYLKHWNKGRPIVIAGHSQGSYLAQRLLNDYFAGSALHNQLVVAYIPGYPLSDSACDPSTGHIPVCQTPEETGCAVAWQSVGKNAISRTNRFPGGLLVYIDGEHRLLTNSDSLVCVNPISWYANGESQPNDSNPGSLRSVIRPGHMPEPVPGICGAYVKSGRLVITRLRDRSFNSTGEDFHIHDYALFWVSIRQNVAVRLEHYGESR